MALQTDPTPQTVMRGSNIVEEFDDLVVQLRSMLDSLQGRVALLTKDMQTVAEIATRVANVLDLGELLPLVAEEVRDGFELHHVNIYTVDKADQRLVLTASTGEEGQKLLRRGYRVNIADVTNIVAYAGTMKQAVIANDVENDDRFDFDDLVLGTRSKMAVPMIWHGALVGVIGVQSTELDRFDDTDIRVKSTLAEQLAGAIEGASTFQDVQRTQRELNESRNLLQSVLDTVPVRVFAKNLDGVYLFANKLFVQDAGLASSEDLVGKTDFELPWADTQAEGFRADDMEVMDSNQPKLDFEEQQTQANGSTAWISTSKVPLHDSRGRVTGILGLYQDVTDRKRAEDREALAYEIGQQLNLLQDPRELFQFAVDLLASAFDYYHVHIYQYNKKDNYLEVVAGLGEAGKVMVQEGHSISYDATRSLVAYAARTLESVIAQDVNDDPTHLPNPLIPETQSEVALPLFLGTELLGVLDVQSDKPNAFNENELRLLAVISSQLAVSLSNAQQLQMTERRLRDIALANQASRIINEADDVVTMLEQVMELVSNAIGADNAAFVEYDEDADRWQGRAAHGINREFIQKVSEDASAFPHAMVALQQNRVETVDNAYEYEQFPMEYVESIGIKSVAVIPIVGRSGKIGVAFFNFNNEFHIFDDAEVALLDGIAQQISVGIESKRFAEANLRMRYLTDSSSDFFGTADLETLAMTYVNQGGLDLIGYTWEEVEGQPIYTIHTKAAFDKITAEGVPVVMSGELWKDETELVHKDGTVIPVEQQIYLLLDDSGSPVALGTTIRDLRERKQAEEALERQAAQFRELVENAPEAIFVADARTGQFIEASQSAVALYETTKEDLMSASPANFAPEYQPDGRASMEVIVENIQRVLAGERTIYDWQVITAKSKTIDTEIRTVLMPDDGTGRPRVRVTMIDISEQRRAERERNRVYDLSIDMIGTAGFDGYFRDLNPAWTQTLGYTPEELKAQPFIEFVHPDDVQRTVQESSQLMAGEPTVNFVNRYKTKDGGWRWLSWNATQDSERQMYYFITRDITQEREREEQIQRRALDLQIVAEVATQAANTLDLTEMLLNVSELTKQEFDLYHAHIYLLEGDTMVLAAGAGQPGKRMMETGHKISLRHENSIVARAGRTGEPVIANDVSKGGSFLPNPLLARTRSELAVPLIYNREIIGVLDIQSTEMNRFTDADALVQQILARQIAVAVQNARVFESEQRIRQENELVAQIGSALSAAFDEDQILQAVQPMLDTAQANLAVLVYTAETDEKGIPTLFSSRAAQFNGEMLNVNQLPAADVTVDDYPVLKLLFDNPDEAVLIEDISTDERIKDTEREWLERAGQQTALVFLPLRSGRRWLGYLGLTWNAPQTFTEQTKQLFRRTQSALATTVETRQAFLREQAATEENQRRARDLETISQVTTASNTILEVDELLKQVCDLTKIAFDLYHAHIYLYDPERELMVLAAGAGDPGDMMVANNHSIPLRHETSIVAQAARDRAGLKVDDVTRSATFLPNPMLPETRSEMSLPMMVGQELIGILDVQSDEFAHFTDEDLEIKSTLAAQVAIAVQNALAFEESQMIAERLREVDRLKSQFLASMSHELRTPLNSIIGYSEVLLDGGDGELSEDAEEDIEIIYNSGRHLLAIINDILDLAKIEANQMKLHKEPTDVVKILQDVIKTNEVLVTNKPIELRLESEVDELILSVDELRIRQVVLNLFSNAVKFTEQGSVSIHLTMQDDQTARIAVKDTGIGISEEGIKIVFDQFRQVDGSSTRKAGGTGLGLTITRYLVEMHGGEISVDSAEGEGSTFWFTLPLVRVPAVSS